MLAAEVEHCLLRAIVLAQLSQSLSDVVDLAETAGLRSVTAHRQVLTGEDLREEGRDHLTVVRAHTGAVGAEDANGPDVDVVLVLVGDCQSRAEPVRLVVAAAFPTSVDVAVVQLGLWEYLRVDVHFPGAGEHHRRIVFDGLIQQFPRYLGVRQRDLDGKLGEVF